MKNLNDKEQNVLLIGDSICLYSEDTHGFLYTCQSSSAYTEIAVGTNQDPTSPDLPNIHGAVFKINVQNRYKFNKELPKIALQLQSDPGDPHLQTIFQQTKAAADAENQDNELEQRRQEGKKLLYGSILQLRHWYTTKYIHVNTTKTSWTEASNMLVELKPENGKTALFKVMPRYKVKAEGEVVQVQDQIIFESVKSPGQFLHCSREPFGALIYGLSHELNLSVKPSGLTVYRHYRPLEEIKIEKIDTASGFRIVEEKVTGGAFIRLYHRELEAYLVAEGVAEMNERNNVYGKSFVNGKFLTQISRTLLAEVHLRVRAMDPSVPRTMYPSSSAITYWQVEKERSVIDGNILVWQEQIRLRHVTTRLYLLVQQDGKVELTNEGQDPRTVFRMHPVTKDSEAVLFDSFVRIEHVVTGFWLHGDSSKPYEARRLSLDSMSMQSLAWSTSQLKEVSTLNEMQYNDAFSLQKVDDNLVTTANYVAGMVPFVHKLVYDLNNNEALTVRRTVRLSTALEELKNFMLVGGFPDKKRQKLLRNFMVVDIIVELLQNSTKENEQASILSTVFSLCYRVLYNYLRGDSRKNELYMARHLDFFMTQLSSPGDIGLNTALMVMELIRDNRKMVDRLTTVEVRKFCELLQQNRNYRFLDLLCVLCICDGIALQDNQNFILEEFLVRSANEGLDSVYYTEVGKNLSELGLKPQVVYISTDGRKTWAPLSEFATKAFWGVNGILTPQSAEDLADNKIVAGKNTAKNHFSSVQDRDLYLFLEYQLKLFSKLCYGRNITAIDQITNELSYLTWEEAFLCISDTAIPDQLRAVYCGLILDLFIEVGSNSPILDRLNLVFIYPDIAMPGQPAVEHNETILEECLPLPFIKQLKHWIWKFLDQHYSMVASMISKNKLIEKVMALLYSLVQFGYYGDTEDIKKLLEPLFSLLDGRNDLPFTIEGDWDPEMDRLVSDYHTKQRFKLNINSAAVMNAKFSALKVIDLFFNFRFNTRLERFLSEFKYTLSLEQSPQGPTELSPFLNPNYNNESDSGLNQKVLKCLLEMFAETGYFGENFVDILMDLCNYESDQIVTASLSLINRYHSAYENLFSRAIQAQVLITEKSSVALTTIRKDLPLLNQLSATGKMNETNVQQLKSILEEFISLCHLPEDKESSHIVNQKILYNHGLFSDIFDILSRRFDPVLTDHYSGAEEVFKMCFEFLRVFAREFPIVQERLFDRLNLLLKTDYALDELSFLFLEIFNGNKSLCLRILPLHINSMVDLLASTRNPALIRVITSLIMVGNLPLKRNQTLVVKALLKYPGSIECVLDSNLQQRIQLIQPEETNKQQLDEKRYFCNIVQLLAFGAWGDNRTVESICQCMFTVDELLDIMNLKQLCAGIRKAFVQFLSSVFLISNSDLALTDLMDFSSNPKLWNYIAFLTSELETATEFATSDQQKARSLLNKKPRRIHLSVNDEIHETKELLHYIFDSALPFFNIYLKTHYIHQKGQETLGDQMDCLNQFQNVLFEFAKAIHPCLTDSDHLKTLLTTSTLVTKTVTMSHARRTLPDAITRGLIKSFGTKEKYEQYYAAEKDLNQKLNTFVINVKTAYGGENTVRQQLRLPIDRVYSDINDNGETDLPLGMEFQLLVKCFMDDEAENRYRNAQKLVHQLDNSRKLIIIREKDRMEQNQLDLKCLQVLLTLVHNEIVQLPEKRAINKRLYDMQLGEIKSMQHLLINMNVVEIILPHMSRCNDSISLAVIKFVTTLLFEGSEEVQNSIVKFFLSTKEETFFFTVKSKMQLSASAIKERRALMAQHKNLLQENQDFVRSLMKPGMVSQVSNRSGRSSMVSGRNMLSFLTGPKSSLKSSSSRVNSSLSLRVPSGGNKIVPTVPKISIQLDSGEVETYDEESPKSTRNVFNETMQELLEYKDSGHFENILQMLALMCDGQNKTAQDYLREQKDNIKSFNLVAETARFLELLYSNVDLENIGFVTQLFETLVEFTQGNQANQMVIFDQKLVDYVNFILRRDTFGGCELDEIWRLKLAIGFIIVSLTEENRGIGHATTVMECVNKDNIHKVIIDAHSLVVQNYNGLNSDTRSIVEQVGYIYSEILLRSFDLEPKESVLRDVSIENCPAWSFFTGKIVSIEILKEDNLQRVYFAPKNKNIISPWIKDKLTWDIDRSSPSVKLQELMRWGKDIRSTLHFQRKIESFFLSRWLVRGWRPLNLITLILSFMINFCILTFWIAPEKNDKSYNYSVAEGRWQPEYNDTSKYLILSFGIIHNITSVLLLVSYFLANKPKLPKFITGKPRVKKKSQLQYHFNRHHTSKLEVNLFGFKTLYYLLFLLMSFMGTFLSSAIFSFHLLHIAANNQLLSRVMKAVTLNGKSLLWVAFMGLILFYIYALVGFSFLRDVFSDNDLFCKSMWECFLTMIREGLVYGMTERFDMQTSNPNFNFKFYAYKLLFDVSFFVIITTISLNIVFGIIVDTFSELRDNKWMIENDLKTTCFICSKNSFEFERYGKGFSHHLLEEHNMWNYLLFFIYLDETHKNNLSALELFVYGLMQEEKCDFFPLGRAMALMHCEDNETDTRLEKLLDQVNLLVNRAKQEELLKAKEKERKRQQDWEQSHGVLHYKKAQQYGVREKGAGSKTFVAKHRPHDENDLGDFARRTQ